METGLLFLKNSSVPIACTSSQVSISLRLWHPKLVKMSQVEGCDLCVAKEKAEHETILRSRGLFPCRCTSREAWQM